MELQSLISLSLSIPIKTVKFLRIFFAHAWRNESVSSLCSESLMMSDRVRQEYRVEDREGPGEHWSSLHKSPLYWGEHPHWSKKYTSTSFGRNLIIIRELFWPLFFKLSRCYYIYRSMGFQSSFWEVRCLEEGDCRPVAHFITSEMNFTGSDFRQRMWISTCTREFLMNLLPLSLPLGIPRFPKMTINK